MLADVRISDSSLADLTQRSLHRTHTDHDNASVVFYLLAGTACKSGMVVHCGCLQIFGLWRDLQCHTLMCWVRSCNHCCA